ncbi:hypothetical protein ACFQS7_12205 [Dankookia sp. GCM10030260]|uniref:hypothetical protein n=1 Tax=Dankookia sp. GCM10030260 TaxID=3273390 RepID=UPI0036168F84
MRIIRCVPLAALGLAAGSSFAQGFSDAPAEYGHGPDRREPGSRGCVPERILAPAHLGGGSLWSDAVSQDLQVQADNAPAKGTRTDGEPAVGLYGLSRGGRSLNGAFALNPVRRDVSRRIAFDADTRSTGFAPARTLLTSGPDRRPNGPGCLTIAPPLAWEGIHDGIVIISVGFDTTLGAGMVRSTPLAATGVPPSSRAS